MPASVSRRCIHSGDGPIVTPTRRAVKRGARSGASTTTVISSASPDTSTEGSGTVSGSPKCAARSRATPTTDIASDRFGVTERSNTTSCRPSTSRTSAPSSLSPSSGRMPSWSSPSPSSRAEQSMPSETSPRILRRSSVKPPGSVAPDGAYATTMPSTTFGAPHTTVVVPAPNSMSQSRSLSAFGCGRTSRIRATRTPLISSPGASSASTSRPSRSSASAIVRGSAVSGTKSVSQERGTRMVSTGRGSGRRCRRRS